MKKGLSSFVLGCLLWGMTTPALAGGVDNKQNFSADFVGTGSRNAAIDGADVAAYNPAGIMQMKNGGYLEFNGQAITLDYDHRINGRDYGLSDLALIPTTFGIYKQDKWALYGTFTINGGGGEVEYKEGNTITQGIADGANAGMFTNAFLDNYATLTGTARPNGASLSPGGVFSNQYAYSESAHYTLTVGGAYALTDALSLGAGIRYIITRKEVDIRGDYSGSPDPVIGKYSQDSDGWGGVVSVNYRISSHLNFAAKYETIVKLDWKTEMAGASRGNVGENILWMNDRVHGREYARDLPAVFATGFEWHALSNLTLCPSFTYYFEKEADWDIQNAEVEENSYDLALALRYEMNEKWSATLGYIYTDIGIKPEDFGIIEKMNPALDCHSFTIGGKYRMDQRWTFTTGIMASFYVSDTAPASVPNPETTYKKDVMTYAVGIQYRFL